MLVPFSNSASFPLTCIDVLLCVESAGRANPSQPITMAGMLLLLYNMYRASFVVCKAATPYIYAK